MRPTVLLPGTLCDGRVFGTLPGRLAAPTMLDHSPFSDAGRAAEALLTTVPSGSLGIAFSLGSWVLLEMLRRDPARFDGIVLISGNAHPDAPDNAIARRARVGAARERGFAAVFTGEWSAMVGPARLSDRTLRATVLAMAEDAGHDSHARQTETNISRPDHRALAAAPPVPIHVIAGAMDRLCPRDRYAQAAAGPASSLTVIDHAGHYVPLEAPDALGAVLATRFPEYCA